MANRFIDILCRGSAGVFLVSALGDHIEALEHTIDIAWHEDRANHGSGEIPPPPAKKSRLDRAKNGIARTAAQMRTGRWRSAEFLKRIKTTG